MSGITLVYTLFPDQQSARNAITSSITDGLAACANMLPACTSFYEWQGAMEEKSEFPVLFKTTAARVETLMERIEAMHPYDVPAILSWPIVRTPHAFAQWVNEQTHK